MVVVGTAESRAGTIFLRGRIGCRFSGAASFLCSRRGSVDWRGGFFVAGRRGAGRFFAAGALVVAPFRDPGRVGARRFGGGLPRVPGPGAEGFGRRNAGPSRALRRSTADRARANPNTVDLTWALILAFALSPPSSRNWARWVNSAGTVGLFVTWCRVFHARSGLRVGN